MEVNPSLKTTPAVSNILKSIEKLSDDEFKELMYRSMESNRPVTIKRSITKHFGRRSAHWEKKKGGVTVECYPTVCPPNQPKPTTSQEASTPAFRNPFIYRSDLIPTDGKVFFDVEKLSLQKESPNAKHKQVASAVSIVNDNRDLLLWSFLKWENVCQTFPSITGISKEKLSLGLHIDVVQPFVKMAFEKNLVVGWDLDNDLSALFISKGVRSYDLTDYFQDSEGQKYSLKDVYKHFFGGDNFQCGIHSAIQDARATRDLYYKLVDLDKQYPNHSTVPFEIKRSPKQPFKNDPNDICRCIKNKNKKSKQPKYFMPE